MSDNYDRRLKTRAIDSKTDLATGTDKHYHVVFKLPTANFLRTYKDMLDNFEVARKILHELGCGTSEEDIIGLKIEKIDDAYFGEGIQITVHTEEEPHQGKCDKCSLHFDTGES